MRDQGEADDSTDHGANHRYGSYGIAAALRQWLDVGIDQAKNEGNEVSGIP